MKLSTAIRIGSMTTRKIVCTYRDHGNGRCALGAAMDAVGIPLPDPGVTADYMLINSLVDTFPILDKVAPHPLDTRYLQYVGRVITDLNDLHEVSRETIADWVAKIEDGVEAELKVTQLKQEVAQHG